MNYDEKSVGEIKLPDGAPNWLNQLVVSVVNVPREDFLTHIESLIEGVKSASRDRAIAQARQLVADNGLELDDVFPRRGQKSTNVNRRGPVAPKYRDPVTGNTWSGRGNAPLWIAGKDRDQYLI